MRGFVGRAVPRDKTRMRATIDCKGHKIPGAVLDLSKLGVCLYLRSEIPVAPGSEIAFQTSEMGHLTGTVRWNRHPRVGVQLDPSSNTDAKVASYYKLLRDKKAN